MSAPLTAELVYPDIAGVPAAARAHVLVWRAGGNPGLPPLPADDRPIAGVAALAYVNAGRWVAECPFPGCRSAQVVAESDRRWLCPECANGGTNRWARVTWPSDSHRARVERELAPRPPLNTNWTPGETVRQLAADNAAHLDR